MTAEGGDAFSVRGDGLVVFLRDYQGKVERVLLHNAISGARLAPKVDETVANAIEADFARRIAEVPERFRGQVPAPGGKEMLLRGIEDMRKGTPNYNTMSTTLAAKVHRQLGELRATFAALGGPSSCSSAASAPAATTSMVRSSRTARANSASMIDPRRQGGRDVLFRPDGNEELGGVAACSEEAALRGRAGTSPIRIMFYNDMGEDVSRSTTSTPTAIAACRTASATTPRPVPHHRQQPVGGCRPRGALPGDPAARPADALPQHRGLSHRQEANACHAARHPDREWRGDVAAIYRNGQQGPSGL